MHFSNLELFQSTKRLVLVCCKYAYFQFLYFFFILVGSVRGVARIIFNTEIEVSLLNTGLDKAADYSTTKEHYVFLVHYVAYNLPPLGKMGYISEEVSLLEYSTESVHALLTCL